MRKLITLCSVACLTVTLTTPAGALDHVIDAPRGPDYGKSTSMEVVHAADDEALESEDISKNVALIPSGFGNASADSIITGAWLTPSLAPEGMAVGAINDGGASIVFPPSADTSTILPIGPGQGTGSIIPSYAPMASDLYHSGNHLGALKIPSIDLSVRVYEGTGSSTLIKGAGHLEGASIWNSNASIAGHNRGVRDDLGDPHTLRRRGTVTWITKLGIRTHEVTSVEGVRETNISGTAPSVENMFTLHTYVRNQWEYRWQVHTVEVVRSTRVYELIFFTESDSLL